MQDSQGLSSTFLFYEHECSACIHVCTPHVCLVSHGGEKSLLDWSKRCFWATIWMLGIQSGSLGWAENCLNSWAILLVPAPRMCREDRRIKSYLTILNPHFTVQKYWPTSTCWLPLLFHLSLSLMLQHHSENNFSLFSIRECLLCSSQNTHARA